MNMEKKKGKREENGKRGRTTKVGKRWREEEKGVRLQCPPY